MGKTTFFKIYYHHSKSFDQKTLLFRLSNSSLRQVALPAGNYEYVVFRKGQTALYTALSLKFEQLSGIYRMGDSGFGNSPIFILVANNRIYSNLSVCQGSPDKIIAVVEDNSGKHWQIELNENSMEIKSTQVRAPK